MKTQSILNPHSKLPMERLGPEFFNVVQPAIFPAAHLRYLNHEALNIAGLDLTRSEVEQYFCRFQPLPGNLPQPLALKYHGHQFMHYNPDLGDGRGFLYAQFDRSSERLGGLLEFGTKGSGTTPYSRRGDGRLTLKGAYREALATEYLQSLGVNTSKTVCFFETGENLDRNDEPSPTRSAVLTRLCQGHVRFGTFQRLVYQRQIEQIPRLFRYCLVYFYPELIPSTATAIEIIESNFDLPFENEKQLIADFFSSVVERHASLVASMMMAGFVHGVLNTDNMNISGECFDYGPYRWAPIYDPEFTAAYFDQSGLYAFGRQPSIFYWNLEQLMACLKMAYPESNLEHCLSQYAAQFEKYVHRYFFQRLNLKPAELVSDQKLMTTFFEFLFESKIKFEDAFFELYAKGDSSRRQNSINKAHYQGEKFMTLLKLLETYQVANSELADHSYFQRDQPETLLIEEIESIWKPIAEHNDWSLFTKKIASLRSFRGIYRLNISSN